MEGQIVRGESVYAGKAEIGTQYVTSGGWAVTVLEINTRCIVRNDITGNRCKLFLDQLLWPYRAELISKEAINMAKAQKGTGSKAEKGARGGERGARKEKEGIIVFRKIGIAMHEVLCHEGVLTYRTKDYMTLKDVAEAIRGKKISGSGRSFFGLRTTGNIELGKEVIKQLSDAEDAKKAAEKKAAQDKAAEQKKARKPKAKKVAEDEEEDDENKKDASTPVGAIVAKVFGRGRR